VRTLQVIHLIITSPARAVAKYCDECVCLSVCLSDIAGILESRAFLQLKEHGKIVSRTATLELGRWSFSEIIVHWSTASASYGGVT